MALGTVPLCPIILSNRCATSPNIMMSAYASLLNFISMSQVGSRSLTRGHDAGGTVAQACIYPCIPRVSWSSARTRCETEDHQTRYEHGNHFRLRHGHG